MLAVVEDQQLTLTSKAVAKRVDDRPVILVSKPEQRCNRQCQALRVKEGRQIDIAHAVRKRGQRPFSEFDCEARLAAATDTGQGEQPRLAQQNGVFVEILFVAVKLVSNCGRLCRFATGGDDDSLAGSISSVSR